MATDGAANARNALEFPPQHQFRHSTFIERRIGIVATIHQMPIDLFRFDPLADLIELFENLFNQIPMKIRYFMKKDRSHNKFLTPCENKSRLLNKTMSNKNYFCHDGSNVLFVIRHVKLLHFLLLKTI
jgi:hypothetical protein